jgi:hypothetical protein
LGQGRDAVKQLLTDNQELSHEIEGLIRAKSNGGEIFKSKAGDE